MKNKSLYYLSLRFLLTKKNSLFVKVVAHELCYLFPLPGTITVYTVDKTASCTKGKGKHLLRSLFCLPLMLIINAELRF